MTEWRSACNSLIKKNMYRDFNRLKPVLKLWWWKLEASWYAPIPILDVVASYQTGLASFGDADWQHEITPCHKIWVNVGHGEQWAHVIGTWFNRLLKCLHLAEVWSVLQNPPGPNSEVSGGAGVAWQHKNTASKSFDQDLIRCAIKVSLWSCCWILESLFKLGTSL